MKSKTDCPICPICGKRMELRRVDTATCPEGEPRIRYYVGHRCEHETNALTHSFELLGPIRILPRKAIQAAKDWLEKRFMLRKEDHDS